MILYNDINVMKVFLICKHQDWNPRRFGMKHE